MDYKEKVKKAEEVSKMILDGISEEEYREKLLQESYKSYEIEKIVKSAEKIISVKYSDKIKAQMLDGSLESHLDDYDELSAEAFEKIQNEQIEQIQSTKKMQLVDGLKQGKAVEQLES